MSTTKIVRAEARRRRVGYTVDVIWRGGEAEIVTIFFFQAEDGIRDYKVTGVQTCALPIWQEAGCAHHDRLLERKGLTQSMVTRPGMALSGGRVSSTRMPSGIVGSCALLLVPPDGGLTVPVPLSEPLDCGLLQALSR